MKKVLKWILKILGILLALILVGVIAAVIYFWPFISSVDWSIVSVDNIKALYIGFVNDTDTLNSKEKDIDDKRAEDIKNYVSVPVREFTDEEIQQIESGEKTKTEIVAQIIAESVEKENAETTVTPENNAGEEQVPEIVNPDVVVPPENNNTTQNETEKKANADAIVAKHIAALYATQNEFQSRVDNLASTARNWMHSYKKTTNVTWKEAKVATVKHFTSTASAIETDCYAKVDKQIAMLESELKAIGADLSIVKTVKESAYSEMEIKKAQIVNDATNRMNKE